MVTIRNRKGVVWKNENPNPRGNKRWGKRTPTTNETKKEETNSKNTLSRVKGEKTDNPDT